MTSKPLHPYQQAAIDALLASPTATMFLGSNAPALKCYDNYEISPCTRTEEPDRPGHFFFEVCEQDEADVWTLYGHIDGEGVEAIGDFSSREQAEQTFQRITGIPFAGTSEVMAHLRVMRAGQKLLAAVVAVKDADYLEGAYQPTIDMVDDAIAEATGRAA